MNECELTGKGRIKELTWWVYILIWWAKKHRHLLGKKRKLNKKRKKEKIRRDFPEIPFKFARGFFTDSQSRTLKCNKEKLEDYLKETCSYSKRGGRLLYMKKPGILFDMLILKAREIERFIKRSCSKVSSDNDVYEKCPQLRYILYLPLQNKWKKRDVAKTWEIAEEIYLSKKESLWKLESVDQYYCWTLTKRKCFGS